MKKILFSIIMLVALLNTVCFAAENTIKFKDVLADDWFFEDINYVQENGLMNGIENEVFGPDIATSRGIVVTTLWRLDGEKICNYLMTFEDVESDQWYTEAVRWATSEKIIKGYDNNLFGTNDLITREQLATILYRYAEYKGIDIKKLTENINTLSFDDIFDVSEWATEGMHFCLATGLIKGMDDNKVEPNGLATRAQLAAIFRRLGENVLTKKESIKHIVTFELGYEGKVLEIKEVVDGEKIIAPKKPTRSGYTFTGWYDKEKSGSKFDFNEEISSDVVIYAQWKKKSTGGGNYTPPAPTTYTVTFDLNGVGGGIAPQTVRKDEKISRPNNPADTDNSFAIWCKEPECINVWDFANDTVTEDTTLYAKWETVASYTMKKQAEWFGAFSSTTTDKTKITDVIFSTTLPQGVSSGVDLTADETGKVKGYIVANGDNYKIYIVGDYIFGNSDSSSMFYNFSNLENIDFGDFDTSNVTSMGQMFRNCSKLNELDLSKFDTSKITIFAFMFTNCSKLEELYIDNFDTSRVSSATYIGSMFNNCINLSSVKINVENDTIKELLWGGWTYENGYYIKEKECVAKIIALSSDFPIDYASGLINTSNESAFKIYYKDDKLTICDNTGLSPFFPAKGINAVTEVSGGYQYVNEENGLTVTVTFNVDGNNITSIVISGYENSYEDEDSHNGTYAK